MADGDSTRLSRRGFLALATLAPAAAAAPTADYVVDASFTSPNQDSRVRTLVLHYTQTPLPDALRILTDPARAVSAHYLVPDPSAGGPRAGTVLRLVDERERAWHAGVSYWRGERQLNAGSIGIEIVNLGYPMGDDALPLMQRGWYAFDDAQIDLVARLARDIVARHAIAPERVVGHGDVAPGRKVDPGPRFPWETLYRRHGLGAWPEAEAVAAHGASIGRSGGIDAARVQADLLRYGYDAPQTGVFDARTAEVVAAFQMHFRPARYDGQVDVETLAILAALLDKYGPQASSS